MYAIYQSNALWCGGVIIALREIDMKVDMLVMVFGCYGMVWCIMLFKRYGWMDEWMDRWMDAWMDRWMDGWMNEWMDGWMEAWMDLFLIHLLQDVVCSHWYVILKWWMYVGSGITVLMAHNVIIISLLGFRHVFTPWTYHRAVFPRIVMSCDIL